MQWKVQIDECVCVIMTSCSSSSRVNNSTLLWPCRSLQCWPKSWTSAGNSCWRERRRSQSWRPRGTTHESVHLCVCLKYALRQFTGERGTLTRGFIVRESHVFPAAAWTSRVPGVPSWAQPEDDSGEEAGPVPSRGLQRGGGPKSPQVPVWAPQSSGWEGEGKTTGGAGASGVPGGRAAVLLSRGESTFLCLFVFF